MYTLFVSTILGFLLISTKKVSLCSLCFVLFSHPLSLYLIFGVGGVGWGGVGGRGSGRGGGGVQVDKSVTVFLSCSFCLFLGAPY